MKKQALYETVKQLKTPGRTKGTLARISAVILIALGIIYWKNSKKHILIFYLSNLSLSYTTLKRNFLINKKKNDF